MRRGGYSILEVFIAGILMSTVFMALASVFPASLGSLRRGQRLTAASGLATASLESWREQDWDTIQKAGTPPPQTVPLDGVTYTVQVAVHAATPAANDTMQVDVTVTWDGGNAPLTLSTCLYNAENTW